MKKKTKTITMLNPQNNVVVVTNDLFKTRWEQLGFVTVNNLTLWKLAVTE